MTTNFPAALFLPKDAYDVSSQQVLGRRIAGAQLAQAFARDLQAGEMLTVVSPGDDAVQAVSQLLTDVTPSGAMVRVCPQATPPLLEEVGALYVPDPIIGRWTPLRHTIAPWSFSLTGVIHTVCSEGALGGIANLPLAPLYPWDAVVCTSRAGRDVVAKAIEHRLDVMASRLGVERPSDDAMRLPQLPIIPLVANADQPYQPQLTRAQRRAHARSALQLSADAFVVAFVGRLSFHSKCHPISMYRALAQLAEEHPEREIVLIECGHIFNQWIAAAFDELRAQFPKVYFRLVGGLNPARDDEKWQVLAAADVFTSPADNLQETFGLALLEGMAAELPLVVSDWNGYRDLVADGENGFLVPTRDVLREISGADEIDAQFALGSLDYDAMIGVRSLGVVVDHQAYVAALTNLLDSPALRQQMEQASARRLQALYSWSAVASSYRDLWAELAEQRAQAAKDHAAQFRPLPNFLPGYASLFDHYSTDGFDAFESISMPPSLDLKRQLCSSMNQWLLDRSFSGRLNDLLGLMDQGVPLTLDSLRGLGLPQDQLLRMLAVLVKFRGSDA
jgi:glycosyltransferase involved in cell wall biosynthesis